MAFLDGKSWCLKARGGGGLSASGQRSRGFLVCSSVVVLFFSFWFIFLNFGHRPFTLMLAVLGNDQGSGALIDLPEVAQEVIFENGLKTWEDKNQYSRKKLYRVIRVADGDTLELEGKGVVRLIGVDTPELSHPLKPVQYYAREATDFVRKLVDKSKVWLRYDQERTDKYGRTLAYVYLEDGRCLNEEIIKNGYGFALTRFPFKDLLKYKRLEEEAKKKELGLWANQGLDEFRWVLEQKVLPYEIYELANNLWAIKYKNYVRLRLTTEELGKVVRDLRQWTGEFSDRDLEKTLLDNGWLKVRR